MLENETPEEVQNEIEEEDQITEAETESETESEPVASDQEETPVETLPEKTEETERPWVKQLRKQYAEQQKELRELREKLKTQDVQTVNLRQRPKLSDPSIDYDQDKFDEEIDKWYTEKREFDAQQEKVKSEQQIIEEQWQSRVQHYSKQREELKAPDFAESEAMINAALSQVQQTVILQGFDDSAAIVYSIGKDYNALEKLSEIKDPIRFALAVNEYRAKMKGTVMKKTPPPPEKTVSVGATAGSNYDRKLAELRAEAEKTGNFNKVIAFRKANQK